LAIFERRLPTGLLAGDEGLETGVDWDKGCCGADTLRCWRAAMRSFKFPAGGVCILELKDFTVKFRNTTSASITLFTKDKWDSKVGEHSWRGYLGEAVVAPKFGGPEWQQRRYKRREKERMDGYTSKTW